MENPLKKYPIQAGMMSFLLPGLGQVFQHRFAAAILWFAAFIAVLWSPYRSFIVVPMALSAGDAQRIKGQTIEWNVRVASYLVVGTIAFFASFSLLVERALVYPELGKMGYVADSLADGVKDCGVRRKGMPSQLSECP